VHYDLKLANVVLDRQDEPYLIDFNLACYVGTNVTSRGTPFNSDPLLLLLSSIKADPVNDVWSLGIMMYELLKGPIPWHRGMDPNRHTCTQLYNQTVGTMGIKFPEPSEADVPLHSCWEALQLDLNKRPTSIELRDRIVTNRRA
jgi:serine/threonine protein kinase